MAGLFVRLKLRLIAGSLRGSSGRQVGFILSTIAALGTAVGGFAFAASLRLAPHHVAVDAAVIGFTGLVAGWTLLSVLVFGVDETLDPSRLAPLPLTRRDLAVGLFAASVTGVWPLAAVAVSIGAVVGVAPHPPGALVGLIAAVLVLALAVLLARAVTTSLAGALRSRRGRDVVVAIALLVPVLPQVARVAISGDGGGSTISRSGVDRVVEVLEWTPPGMLGRALHTGNPLWLAIPAVVVGLLAWWWVAALGRELTTVDASTQGAAVKRSRWNPSGQLGGVVVKELAYTRRDPRRTMAILSSLVVTLILGFSWVRGGISPSVGVAFGAAIMGLHCLNMFGNDGRAFWMNVLAWDDPREVRTDLAGRQLAFALVVGPALAALAVVAALVGGKPDEIAPAVLVGLTVLAITLGLATLNTVLAPVAVPERSNPFSTGVSGQGCLAGVASMALMLATFLLALPVVLPAALEGPVWVPVAGLVYGASIAWLGRLVAGNIAYRRLPEIHAAVSAEV